MLRTVGAWRLPPFQEQGETNMKILTFRRLIGLAAIGGFAYAHRQRGGDWTMASIKDTARHLWSSASGKAGQLRETTRDTMSRAASAVESGTRTGVSDQPSSRSYGTYSGRDDERNRH
jgi:hypothetical protein